MSQELRKEAGDQQCPSITHKTASCEVKNMLQLNNTIFSCSPTPLWFRDDRPQHQSVNLSLFLCRSGCLDFIHHHSSSAARALKILTTQWQMLKPSDESRTGETGRRYRTNQALINKQAKTEYSTPQNIVHLRPTPQNIENLRQYSPPQNIVNLRQYSTPQTNSQVLLR